MTIALHRPGAIGDILLTANLIPLLRASNPGQRIEYYCHRSYAETQALGTILHAAGVDLVRDCAHWDARNPSDGYCNLIGYPLHEGYPEKPMRRHLLEYFAAELGLKLPYGLPRLLLPAPERLAGLPESYVTLQVKTGWSIWKEWPLGRWFEVITALPHIHFVQLGMAGEPRVPGADHRFMGGTLQQAFQLIGNASLHVGVDSFAQHAAHFRWGAHRTPAVVLWGSTQLSAAGYPDNVNITSAPPCQPCFRENEWISKMPRGPCPIRHKCMVDIHPSAVIAAIRKLWEIEP